MTRATTSLNLWVLGQVFLDGADAVANRVAPAHRGHVVRLARAGLVELAGSVLRLTPAGRAALGRSPGADVPTNTERASAPAAQDHRGEGGGKSPMPKTKTKTATKGACKAEAKPPAPKPNAKPTGKKKAEQTVPALQKALPAASPASQTKRHSTKKDGEKAPVACESIDHVATSTESTTPLAEAPIGAAPAPLPPAASADVTPASPASIASDRAAAEAPKPTSESRLPPPGTVLQRRDRRGQILSECVVVEGGGVRYAGTVYASLSAAALAAARDRGCTTSSINGWSYWGLTKPARTAQSRRDSLTLLDAAWVRFRQRVNNLLGEDVDEEARGRVLAQLKEHAKALERLGSTAA